MRYSVSSKQLNGIVYLILAFLCLIPFITAPIALFLGSLFANINYFMKFGLAADN